MGFENKHKVLHLTHPSLLKIKHGQSYAFYLNVSDRHIRLSVDGETIIVKARHPLYWVGRVGLRAWGYGISCSRFLVRDSL
jgi:hypothetical protein